MLRGAGNLMRPRQIQGARNLETPAHFEHGDDVAEGDAFEQPQTRRSDIHGALGIVERIGLVRTLFGEYPSQLYWIFSGGEFMRYPGPIVLGIRLLSGAICAGLRGQIGRDSISASSSRKSSGFATELLGIFSSDEMGWIVFIDSGIREAGEPGYSRCRRDLRRMQSREV